MGLASSLFLGRGGGNGGASGSLMETKKYLIKNDFQTIYLGNTTVLFNSNILSISLQTDSITLNYKARI